MDTCGSEFDTELGIFTLSSTSGTLIILDNNDDSSFCSGEITQSQITFTFEAGVEYFIVVEGFNDAAFGNYNLNIVALPPPPPPSPPPLSAPGNTVSLAFLIEKLPFSTSGNSAGFTSTISLGSGPDVIFAYTSAEVRRIMSIFSSGKKNHTRTHVYGLELGD